MPGAPQVWYLDLFAGSNDYEAADNAGVGGHKEINRTTLSVDDITAAMHKEVLLKQLELIRFRNTYKSFLVSPLFHISEDTEFKITWTNDEPIVHRDADLANLKFSIRYWDDGAEKILF